MAKRKSPEHVEPPLLAYSFDDCPEDKLSSCCEYEYLASSQLIRDAVERFRAGQKDPLAKQAPLLFSPLIFWTLTSDLWPKPYLEILLAAPRLRGTGSSSEPKRRRKAEYLAELVTPEAYLPDPKETERVVRIYLNPYLSLPQLKTAITELLMRDYSSLVRNKPRLKAALADLLRRKNPQLFKDLERLKSRRGRGSPIEQYRTDLKALSAWRLNKQFGYSAQAAIDLMRARRLSTYQDVTSFWRGVGRAAQRIAALEQQLDRYAEKMTA
jgi:hypothetical protein